MATHGDCVRLSLQNPRPGCNFLFRQRALRVLTRKRIKTAMRSSRNDTVHPQHPGQRVQGSLAKSQWNGEKYLMLPPQQSLAPSQSTEIARRPPNAQARLSI